MQTKYIKVKDKDIPVIIREYSNARYIKIYFKGDALYISKPKYASMKRVMELFSQNEEKIYKEYCKLSKNANSRAKKWEDGDIFTYKGEEYTVKTNLSNEDDIKVKLNKVDKIIEISYPKDLSLEERKMYVDKCIKKLLKNNTEYILQDKVPYWSKVTKIPYKYFKVNDAKTKFGSCIPSEKIMHFSSRLIMLPEDKIDSVIVHELCHIVYPNHSQDFYNLVKKYIPNYDEINQWLKDNGRIILF